MCVAAIRRILSVYIGFDTSSPPPAGAPGGAPDPQAVVESPAVNQAMIGMLLSAMHGRSDVHLTATQVSLEVRC